jgi:hypothetical protein
MKRLLFYFLRFIAFCCRAINHKTYLKIIVLAYKSVGVEFLGMPSSLDLSAHVDPSGGLTISKGCGISVNAVILTHDWSFLRRYRARELPFPTVSRDVFDRQAYRPVFIGEQSLIGAGAIILPGSNIGKYCIIGSGAVVKGKIEDYSIMIGNPAKKIGDTRDPKYKLL